MRTRCKGWTLLVGLLATGVFGCGTEKKAPAPWNSADVGRLQVPLTGSAPSGLSYRLTNAVFEVRNFFTGFDTTVSGDDSTLQIELAPSVFPFDYQISLLDGWTLSAINPDGTEQPISATLLSNFISFTIKPARTTPVAFQFKASEQVITTGNGSASVTIAVDDTLIDDFEDGDGAIALIGGRRGTWFTFNDGVGTQTPAPGTPVLPEVLDTSANFLLHTTGSGFALQGEPLPDGSFGFGAGVGSNLLFDASTGQSLPYDASKYAGINFNFFTRSDPGLFVPLVVSFLVGTSATTPVDQGGTCTDGCSDDFGFVGSVPPGDFFFPGFPQGIPWSALTQQGFGTPATFDPATILTIKWIMGFPNFGQPPFNSAFDFRLDDVTFTANASPIAGGGSAGGAPGGGTGGSTGMGGRGGPIPLTFGSK